MRKFFMLLCMCCTMGAWAQGVEKVGSVELGRPYGEALEAIKAEFGEPVSATEDEVVYGKKSFMGLWFDEVRFRFKGGRFNEARFFSRCGSKGGAQKRMEEIAKVMGSSYSLSRDVEDDNTWFYKGGNSPVGFGHLFTIYTYPKKGAYGAELRYGPIPFAK